MLRLEAPRLRGRFEADGASIAGRVRSAATLRRRKGGRGKLDWRGGVRTETQADARTERLRAEYDCTGDRPTCQRAWRTEKLRGQWGLPAA
jgi:hypothetical protein